LYYLVNWHEPFALAPHEALACGTPVLATPNGALKEYIKPGWNGFLVENYSQAIEAIEQLKQMNAGEWETMSRRCRESAYTIEESVKLHIEMYQKVIRQKFLYTEQEAMAIGFTNPPAIKIKKPLL
jgi:glycosyltransferase involved in cell wall biosynthesis